MLKQNGLLFKDQEEILSNLITASDFTNACENPDEANDDEDDVVYYDSDDDVPLSALLK